MTTRRPAAHTIERYMCMYSLAIEEDKATTIAILNCWRNKVLGVPSAQNGAVRPKWHGGELYFMQKGIPPQPDGRTVTPSYRIDKSSFRRDAKYSLMVELSLEKNRKAVRLYSRRYRQPTWSIPSLIVSNDLFCLYLRQGLPITKTDTFSNNSSMKIRIHPG